MNGILRYGAYLPHYRLKRTEIGAALGVPTGRGTRAVAAYDEDSTSMAVEAGRRVVGGPAGPRAERLYFSTTTPAYLDKTNATAVHAALGLEATAPAFDMVGAVRSVVGALRAALDGSGPTLVIGSDVRTGLPGSGDEGGGGDGAAAVVVGTGTEDVPVIAEYLGGASATAEFLDRWRVPGDRGSQVWEERFGEQAYLSQAQQALPDAFKSAGLTPADIDHFIVTGTHARAARGVLRSAGVAPEAAVDDLTTQVGNAGAAHPLLLLASVLDTAEPNAVVALLVLSDGAEVLLFRTTEALAECRAAMSVADQIAASRDDLPYPTFLTWRGMLDREPPRRPDLERPAAPVSRRSEDWKFAFTGSRCTEMVDGVECGTRHLPPQRVCVRCGAIDKMDPEPLADVGGTITTFTVDRLAYSLSPPVVLGVVDFDGGGRYQCELTDVDPAAVAIGDRVAMTFRRLYTAKGVHNYFWKARPE